MDLHGWIFENLLYVAGRVHEPIFYERLCGEAQPLAQPRHSNPSSVNRSSSFRENVVADALYAISGIVCHCRESDVSGPPYGNLRLVTPKLRLEIQPTILQSSADTYACELTSETWTIFLEPLRYRFRAPLQLPPDPFSGQRDRQALHPTHCSRPGSHR